jgi:hypothetical protein
MGAKRRQHKIRMRKKDPAKSLGFTLHTAIVISS